MSRHIRKTFRLTSVPDLTDIYELAYKVLEDLPGKFRCHTENILIRVENFADEKTLESLSLLDRNDLLGLYRGVPVPLKGAYSAISVPDTVFLYRCPLVRFAKDHQESMDQLISHVVLHEMGHHFGFSDFDMAWIDRHSV